MTRDGKSDPATPRLKKSETLEVRIPYETKLALMNACKEDGTTASEVVRDQVQSYLAARERSSHQEEKRAIVMQLPTSVRRYGPRVAAGGIAAIGLTALAVLPSAANPDFKAQFSRLDANGDGVLSEDEFANPARGGPGIENKDVVVETRMSVSKEVKAHMSANGSAEVKQDAYTFWLPEEIGGPRGDAPASDQREFRLVSRHEIREGDDADVKEHTFSFNADDLRKSEFAKIDANKDGKVSLAEYQSHKTALLTRGFEVLDANADKALSLEEYSKITSPPKVKLTIAGGPDTPEPPALDIPGVKAATPEALNAAFTRLDANKDGKLSLSEYLPKA